MTFSGAVGTIFGMKSANGNRANPFRPGAGTPPPHFAGRKEDLRISDECLDALRPSAKGMQAGGARAPLRRKDGDNTLKRHGAPMGPMVIYGPRGNGKTALLLEIAKQAKAKGIQTIRADPSALANPDAFATRLRQETRAREGLEAETRTHFQGEVRVGPASISAGKATRRVVPTATLADALLAVGGTPALLAIDEAHRLPLESGELLLRAEQDARGAGAKIQLVLAGTPDLPDHLRRMNATFWDRLGRRRRSIGLLKDEDGWLDSISKPMKETLQADIDDGIAPRLLELTSGYPYFLQAMGAALWDWAAQSAKVKSIVEVPAQAEQAFARLRAAYYENRVLDLQRKGALGAAHAVARLADLTGGWERLIEEQIRVAAQAGARLGVEAEGASIPTDIALALRHEGFLWREPPGGQVACGIPTLSGHVTAHIRQQFPRAARDLDADPEFAELVSGAQRPRS